MNKGLIIQMRNIYKYIIINLLLLIIGVPLSATLLTFGLILLGHFTGWDSYNNHLAFALISLIGAGILSGALQNKLARLPANIWLALAPVVTLLCASCLVELLLLYAANAEFESDLFLLYHTIYPAFSLCLFPFEEQMGDPVALRAIIPLMPALGWLCFMLTLLWRSRKTFKHTQLVRILLLPAVLFAGVLLLLGSQFYDRQQRLVIEEPAVMVIINRQTDAFAPDSKWLIYHNWPRVSGDGLFSDFISALYRNLPGDRDAWHFNDTGVNQPDWSRLMMNERDAVFVPPLTKAQREEATSRGIKLYALPVARDELVFVTHPDNPLSQLATQQIQAIYAGEINNWQEVNGAVAKIWPYQSPAQYDLETASQQMMQERVMQGKSLRRAPDTMADEGVVNLIRRRAHYQNRPESLGYFWRSEIMRSNKLKEIKILAVDNVQPATARACQTRYPYVSDIWLVTTMPLSPEVKRLIAAITSPQGREWVNRQGYIPFAGCGATGNE